MTNQSPKVSIILPTYNRAYLIGRAIQSILNQTYQDFEIIIIDDGSKDDTEKIIRGFKEKDNRIKYISFDANKGAAAARNAGIKMSKGEYITFQDSDDEWVIDKLEKQMKVIETSSENIVVYCGFWRIDGDEKIYIPDINILNREGNINKELLKGNFVGTPSILLPKKNLEKVGMFDKNLSRLQDWDLAIRLSKYYNFKLIDEPLYISYVLSDSISANYEALIIAMQIILAKYQDEIYKDHKIIKAWSIKFNSIAKYLLNNNDIKKAKQLYWRAIKLYPFWRGNYIDLAKYLLK
jgi:glycosyltransferase involved in cell wall biosynthesis